ncbi:uronate dehydrogenase [Paraburkholderia sp. RAU2J]|uniref:NAD-dependent epimerase/dehydratase family protein n=1 Tax=Paraburkholderia sp. RAU2J TaxID=1938810 RepID=UPI000EB15DD9|nr:NAD(P)-dependent oxidoreductase [Paraburkholderia sp. RAU2J]RKT21471.1 uronate dehydrogenase [Paraburkholderia sp. RAU2J]
MKKIALSGAGGQLGAVVRAAMIARGTPLRSAAGSKALTPLVEGEDVMHGDLRDPAVVDRLLEGVDVLIHFAGTSVERPLPEIIENNLRGLVEVYEGARRHGVKRIVFASSNHAIGMYPVTEKLSLDCELRPDGFYGLSKVWGEALARMYWDKHGIESVCVRIGSCVERPTEPRHLSTWFGHRDLMHFLDRCVEAENVGFLTIWGVSANTRSWWDNSGAARFGYQPTQNAEDYAAEILARPNPLDAFGQRFQGGAFVGIDYSREDGGPDASAATAARPV